jgi:anti-sigma regulatory factor (Ser/Thr protein kinase)
MADQTEQTSQLQLFADPSAARRGRTAAIREFILRHVHANPQTISQLAAEEFGISRRAVNRHIRELTEEGFLRAEGATRARIYALRTLDRFARDLPVNSELQEDVVWANDIAPRLDAMPKNVFEICQYGFTEMLNNVIDHSASPNVSIIFERTAIDVTIRIADYGIGIFKKIAAELGLEDEHHAILEIAKGKLTTDPDRHSGEGIFFTSRMFDRFGILSGKLYFGSIHQDDWLLDTDGHHTGTYVILQIDIGSNTKAKDVFDRFTGDFKDYGFSRTNVPVNLMLHEGEKLVSRSQAKRLLNRVDRFTEVVLDFEGIETVGQAFADEIFRVFPNSHPEVHIVPIRASSEVQQMINRALVRGE